MKSGSQGGLDLNWDISFSLSGVSYKWFFEAKGKGFEKYKRDGAHENFQISLISDKLLQLIGRSDLNIDCWCLFAPYIRLDGGDRRELESIGRHLPFHLVIWDKNILPVHLGSCAPMLFKKIYSKAKKYPQKIELNQVVSEIKSSSIKGRFQRNIHRHFYILRDEFQSKCERTIIFCKEPQKGPRSTTDKYFFEFQRTKYYVRRSVLEEVNSDLETTNIGTRAFSEPKIEKLIAALGEARSGGNNLFEALKNLLKDKSAPFVRVAFLKKLKGFDNLDFIKINSSSFFGVVGNKDILFETFEDYL